jgi:two-component system, NtrC family, sensor kinase
VRHILGGLESRLDPESLALLEREGWRKAVVRLGDAERGATRIEGLIIKLRTFSRLDEGERKVASMRECVESTVAILHHRLDEDLRIVLRLDGPDLVDCYPGLLNQALLNLVANALDALAGSGEVTIATNVRQGNFELTVSDTGPGIPAALLDRVLEPFFTTKPVGQGTGLGLSIAYSIAKKHGGELTVGSAPGGGAQVTLSFPLLESVLAQ